MMRQSTVAPLAVAAAFCIVLLSGGVVVRVLAGDITSKISGKWQEFEHGGAEGLYVKPCLFTCSGSSTSEPLGTNEGPWTYTYASGCTMLTVVEGRGTGTTIFEIEDNGKSLGNTSMGVRLNDCQEDPDFCYKDQYSGKGSFLMLPGSHSFNIKQVYQTTPIDGGWFRINTTACPTPTISPRPTTKLPTKPPATLPKPTTKRPTKKPTTKPTNAPQSGTAPSKPPTKPPTKAPATATTKAPTKAPAKAATKTPTKAPAKTTTNTPTKAPAKTTTSTPTKAPAKAATQTPTMAPLRPTTKSPTKAPQSGPTPTAATTRLPTKAPQAGPTTTKPPTSTATEAPSMPIIPNGPPSTSEPTPNSPNPQCWSAARCAKRLTTSRRCPCWRFQQGNKRCMRRQSFRLCCPNREHRPEKYAPAVVRAATTLCRRQNNHYLVLPSSKGR